MKKIFSVFLSLMLYTALVPVTFATDSAEHDANSVDQAATITCPDPDAEITFEGARAKAMAALKERNPQQYQKLIDLMKLRQNKLAQLCKNHPGIYEKIIHHKEWVLKHKTKQQIKKDEHKSEALERTKKFCTERPNAPLCKKLTPNTTDGSQRIIKKTCTKDSDGKIKCEIEKLDSMDDNMNDDDGGDHVTKICTKNSDGTETCTVTRENDEDEGSDESGNHSN